MQKRPTFLLEALIALFIVSIALLPLFKSPFSLFTHKIALLEKIELQRIAELTFLEIREKLLVKPSWHSFYPKEKAKPIKLSSYPLILKNFSKKKVNRSYLLYIYSEKTGEGKVYRYLHLDITLEVSSHKETFSYRIFAEKVTPSFSTH